MRDSGLPADSAVVLTIVPVVFRLWRHYETFPSSVSLSPSLFFDERVAQLFLKDLKVERLSFAHSYNTDAAFSLSDGKRREVCGKRSISNFPTAHFLAPAMPLAPGWKSWVP